MTEVLGNMSKPRGYRHWFEKIEEYSTNSCVQFYKHHVELFGHRIKQDSFRSDSISMHDNFHGWHNNCSLVSEQLDLTAQQRRVIMFQTYTKRLALFIFLLLTALYLSGCGGGGGSGDSGGSTTGTAPTATPSLQSSTITGVLATQASVASRLLSIISPTSAIANIQATLYLDNSSTPVYADAQDRFTITNVPNGDHSLYIHMGDGTNIEFPFRMAANRGLDFGRMTLANGQVHDFTGFNGYHFGWFDDDGDGINDHFADANGDGVCDAGHHYAGYSYMMDLGFVDADHNGINDHFIDADGDGDNDLTGHPYGQGFGFIDVDHDGINDNFKDANGDGICDFSGTPYSHPFGFADANHDSINDRFVDHDGDGVNDRDDSHYVAMPGWVDLDGDGVHDFFGDADGDGIDDVMGMAYAHGFGWSDANNDGKNDHFVDEDGDGINDLTSGMYGHMTYGYGYQGVHHDANGDGIDDDTGMPYRQCFGWVDSNGDGINDVFKDGDHDGVNDVTNRHYDHGFTMAPGGGGSMGGTSDWPMGTGGSHM
jgi:hypothetical protein